MKKFLMAIFVPCIAVFMTISVFGANGKIIQGKTIVPVRGVFESFGFNVEWDSSTETAIIKNNNYTIEIPKGKNYFFVNGEAIEPDVAQKLIDGVFYIPLRAVSDSIGASTSWNSSNKTARISYGGKDVYVNCKTNQAALESQIPNWVVYEAGEYDENDWTFSVNIYTSSSEWRGVIYSYPSDSVENYENSTEYYEIKTNIYKCVGGRLDGSTIGFANNKMIIFDGDFEGSYTKTEAYQAP